MAVDVVPAALFAHKTAELLHALGAAVDFAAGHKLHYPNVSRVLCMQLL